MPKIDIQEQANVDCEHCPVRQLCTARNCYDSKQCPLVDLFRQMVMDLEE